MRARRPAVYLGGQGDDDFSGDGAVFPLLCGFGGIPECGAFGSPLGGVGRQDDGALDDAFFVAVGVDFARPLVGDVGRGTVGGRSGGGAPCAAADGFHGKVIDGHASVFPLALVEV